MHFDSRIIVLTLGLLFVLLLGACSQTPVDQTLNTQGFGTAADDGAFGITANSTGVYVVGDTLGNLDGVNKGGEDAFLRKYNDGVVWTRQFGTRRSDTSRKVVLDSSGNSYVLGNTYGGLGLAVCDYDVFLRKYDAFGRVQWTRQFGALDANPDAAVIAIDLAIDSSNNIYVLSNEHVTSNPHEAFTIRKYNPRGSLSLKLRRL